MANYNSKKNRTGRIVAGVLIGVLAVAAAAGAGMSLYMGIKNNGWFEKEVVEEDNTVQDENAESTNSMVLENTESHGITLTATKLTANAEEIEEENGIMTASLATSYTLTATYNEGATSPSFTWTVSGSGVTLTPSSDTKSCTVTCSGAFGTQITITCTADDNSSAYATCTADYVKRLTGIYIDLEDDSDEGYSGISLGPTSGSTKTWNPNSAAVYGITFISSLEYSYGTGTVTESYTINSMNYYSNVVNSSTAYSLNGGSFSAVTFLSNITGISSSSSTFLRDVYNKLVSFDSTNNAVARLTASVTGNTTGETFTVTHYLYINPSNMYTSVSSVSLSNTSLAF